MPVPTLMHAQHLRRSTPQYRRRLAESLVLYAGDGEPAMDVAHLAAESGSDPAVQLGAGADEPSLGRSSMQARFRRLL